MPSLKSVFLTAEWRYLLMANYEVPPEVLQPYVPPGTELDFKDSKTYVSMVGFRFLNTRLKGIPVPFHQNFTEVNLRFYVRHHDGNVWKRGTVFISEIVPKPAIAWVANGLYNEHYSVAPLRHCIQADIDSLKVEYQWKKGYWNTMQATASTHLQPIEEDSMEAFILEHYWGYTTLNEQTIIEYGVEHPRWQCYPVTRFEADYNAVALYGLEFAPLLHGAPDSVFLAHGSEVLIRALNRLPVAAR